MCAVRLAIFSIVCLIVWHGVQAQQSCPAILQIRVPTVANIFDPEQERLLGEIEAQEVERNYRAAADEELEAHVNAVAGRILSHLPRDQAPVRVLLIDTSGADAFSAGPERIYVTRKMVALLRNDDELAGLLGHELGHIQLHQNAIIVSHLFQKTLGVNAVSDRKDIAEKFERMLDSLDRDPKMLRKAAQIIDRQEMLFEHVADQYALYLTSAIGYSPQAFAELFSRSAELNDNSKSLLSGFFGTTTSNQWRLEEIKKNLKRLPRQCRENSPAASPEFLMWQAEVLSYPDWARR
jgi:predicted Zn-dependent protease